MRLLLTGAWAQAADHAADLQAMGHTLWHMPQESGPLPCDPSLVEGVVCNGLFLHHRLEEFPALRYIQLTSAGLDRVPLEQIRARGIALRNARGVYSIPMAEFALCGVLQVYKQADFFRRNQQACRWEKHRDLEELWGKTVTILGCGSVGTACAVRFGAFGCRVLGVDLYPRQDAAYGQMLPLSALEEVLGRTDVLVLTLPLTDETRGLMDRRRLSALKPGAVLVNLARGALVDAGCLPELLTRGPLSAAVLDVFDPEPLPPESPLWQLPNVILTPHNSFVGRGNGRRLSELILANLREVN